MGDALFLTALGMVLRGLGVSEAARPTSSVPANEKAAVTKTLQTPLNPFANPPVPFSAGAAPATHQGQTSSGRRRARCTGPKPDRRRRRSCAVSERGLPEIDAHYAGHDEHHRDQ